MLRQRLVGLVSIAGGLRRADEGSRKRSDARVGLFGPTDPKEFGFRVGPHRHVYGHGAMTSISVADVVGAVESRGPLGAMPLEEFAEMALRLIRLLIRSRALVIA